MGIRNKNGKRIKKSNKSSVRVRGVGISECQMMVLHEKWGGC